MDSSTTKLLEDELTWAVQVKEEEVMASETAPEQEGHDSPSIRRIEEVFLHKERSEDWVQAQVSLQE